MLTRKHAKLTASILVAGATLAMWAVLGLPGGALADPPPHNHGGGGGGGDDDTTPPDAVDDLVAAPGALGAISLTWTAVGDDGGGTDCTGAGRASDYDVRYSTASPADAPYDGDAEAWFADATPAFWEPLPFRSGPSACGFTETFCISALDPGVTYHAALTVEDDAGNISALSNVANAVAQDTLGFFMHVDDIQVLALLHRGTRRGVAVVTIVDENLVPVEGATVTGHWTGCNFNGQPGSAVTDCNGLAVVQKNNACHIGDFCNIVFTVSDVAHDTAMYEPADNVEDNDSTVCF